MTSKLDTERKREKTDAVVTRIREMGDNLALLVGMLDEGKLDLMILALGIGEVELRK